LQKPIKSFASSEEFIAMCNLNGFDTLGDILELEVNEMLAKPEFNVRMLMELYSILKNYQLEKCIKEG
jgi:hypothetical protein